MARQLPRNRYLNGTSDVYQHNAWDNVDWDEQQQEEADAKVAANAIVVLGDQKIRELDDKADFYWNQFYQTHQRNFFKDRHWLFTEFSELLGHTEQKEYTFNIFEIGCGVGNTMFPILEMKLKTDFIVYGCDFSPVAIDLLKSNEIYDGSKCQAFVLDVTKSQWNVPFNKNSIDVILLIFTLSAIDPSKIRGVVERAFEYLKPGGMLLFRDYGRYDMAQLRFKPGRCLGGNFYVRGDGTRAYFFADNELHDLFTSVGFEKKDLLVDRRLLVNRSTKVRMFRVWIQAKYRKPEQ